MNTNLTLYSIEIGRLSKIKEYGLGENMVSRYREIREGIAPEDREKYGKELYEFVSSRSFKDSDDDFRKVVDIVLKGADLDYKESKKGNFSLLVCARKGFEKTFLFLLKAGADVNQSNNYLTTSLMAAARHGHLHMLELLVLCGADVNAKCLDGDDALSSASRHGKRECVDFLIQEKSRLLSSNLHNYRAVDFDPSLAGDSGNVKRVTYEDTQLLIDKASKDFEALLKK